MAEMIEMKERTKRETVPMKEQPPSERIHNFKEVPLGYTKEEQFMKRRDVYSVKIQPV